MATEAAILIFWLPPKTPQPVANRFGQKFFGQDVTTWHGRYKYRKEGLLDDLPHRKLRRGVVILRETDLPVVETFLTEWKIPREVRIIRPTSEDISALTSQQSD